MNVGAACGICRGAGVSVGMGRCGRGGTGMDMSCARGDGRGAGALGRGMVSGLRESGGAGYSILVHGPGADLGLLRRTGTG